MVGVHYCMGEVESVSLFAHADGCKMKQELPPCHKHQKPDCCADEAFTHDGAEFKASIDHITLSAPVAVPLQLPVVLLDEVIPSLGVASTNYIAYDPPLQSADLIVSLQVFLI